MTVEAQQPRATLYKALAAAQRRAQAVEKDATNAFHRYKYASAEAIIAEAREALAAEGLSVFPVSIDRDESQPEHRWSGEGADAFIATPRRIRATYLLLHESGESMDFTSTTPVIPEKGRPEDKAEFGARTENLGYTLRDLLLLPRVNEETAQNAPSARDDRNHQQRPPQQTRPQPSTQPQGKPSAVTEEQDKELGRLIKALGWAKPKAAEFAQKVVGKGYLQMTGEDGDKLIAALKAELPQAGAA